MKNSFLYTTKYLKKVITEKEFQKILKNIKYKNGKLD